MGKVYSFFLRPIRTFNIENRAERVISKGRPIPAPHHASVQQQKELADKLSPNFMDNHYKKDSKLDSYLKDVFVSSMDPLVKPREDETVSSRPLPQNRSQPLSDKHFYEPPVAARGKCTLTQVVQFLSMYQQNPIEHPVEKISQEYKLDKQVVENIIKHYSILNSMDLEKAKKDSTGRQ